jgi:hypothetical protein
MTPEIVRARHREYGPASHARHRRQFMLANQYATAAKLAQEWREESELRATSRELDETYWHVDRVLDTLRATFVGSPDAIADAEIDAILAVDPVIDLCDPAALVEPTNG